MKKIILFLLCYCTTIVCAQDVIVKKDGSTILAKICEINSTEIEYRKHSNPQGPIYAIEISEVLAVNYENGTQKNFSTFSSSQVSPITPKNVEVVPFVGARNQELLDNYNKQVYQLTPDKKWNTSKDSYHYLYIWGFTPESVISNEHIELVFERYLSYNSYVWQVEYGIQIRNKTDKKIVVDKANCFRHRWRRTNMGIGESDKIYFEESDQVTITKTNQTSAALGLYSVLGANAVLGGSNATSVSQTYNADRFLIIPPHGMGVFCEHRMINIGFRKWKVLDSGEFFFGYSDEKERKPEDRLHQIKIGESRILSPEDKYDNSDYIITYAVDGDFSNFCTLKFGTYVRQVIGMPKKEWNKSFNAGIFNYISPHNDYIIYCGNFLDF